jgi:hypothetical protein
MVRAGNRIVWLAGLGVAGLGLAVLAGGCQGGGRSAASGGAGPSPLFGQAYAPSQSEPPVEDGGSKRKTASRAAAADSFDDIDGGSAPATTRGRSRWLPGNDKEPAPRKALPVSARTDATLDDDDAEQ